MALIKSGVIFAISCSASHFLLVFFPDPLFPHHYTYRNYTVHMRDQIPPQIQDVLQRVDALLAVSSLNDDRRHHHIYLINNFHLSRWLLLRNVHFGCCLPTGQVFLTSADVVGDRAHCQRISTDDHRERTLSGAITHEIVHTLIRQRLGWFENQRLPAWLKEGYCDFVARDSAIPLDVGVMLVTDRTGPMTPGLFNFKARLVVDYLITVRNLTIEQMINDPPPFAEVLAEVTAALQAEGPDFVQRLGSWSDSTDPTR